MKLKLGSIIVAAFVCTLTIAGTASAQTTTKPPEKVAQDLVDAYNARNMEGILAAYASDSTAYSLPGGEIILKGHDQIRKKFARVLEPNVKLKVEIVSRIVDGKFVIDKEKIIGTSSGKAVEFYGTVIYEITGGLIRRE